MNANFRPGPSSPQTVVTALVDYDNAKPNKREYSQLDVATNAERLLDALSTAVGEGLAGVSVSEIRVRFYGGWIDQRNQYSVRAQWLMVALTSAPRRRGIHRVIPELVTSLAHLPTVTVVGTVRADRTPSEQKMVDTMITTDSLLMASRVATTVLIVSDDDDFVPPALAGTTLPGGPIALVRQRSPGAGLNDHHCSKVGVPLLVLRY